MSALSPAQAGLLLLSYLAGGIPTGYLVVRRLSGFDIRQRGSGNPGAANVYRTAGPLAGGITLFVDALKGSLPVLAAAYAFPGLVWLHIAVGAAAVIGHDWTPFLGFRGGKGVATSTGVFLALAPAPTLGAVLAFGMGFRRTGHISVGSMVGACALPLFCVFLKSPAPVTGFAAALAALILYKHIPNIRRLREQRELFLHEKK